MDFFLHIFRFPAMNISTPGANLWDAFSGATKYAKKSPFYTVKWRFFAYFPFPSNEYLYSWGKLVGYAFSGATTKAKKFHFTV